jgi:hypothetical protein
VNCRLVNGTAVGGGALPTPAQRTHVLQLFTLKAAIDALLRAIDTYNATRTPEAMQLVLDLQGIVRDLSQ